MGYTTWFEGGLTFNKEVTPELRRFINEFSSVRHMKRDVEIIKKIDAHWKENCFFGDLGEDGAFYIGGQGFMGQDIDESVIDHNRSGAFPSLWCDWCIDENEDVLRWNDAEKFYGYVECLDFLITNFFSPLGYVLNGTIQWDGEDIEDKGVIVVKDNIINTRIMYPTGIVWVGVSEMCPEEDNMEVLVTLRSGRVTLATYMADEEGDYWMSLNANDEPDMFFNIDPVIAWSDLPKGY